MTAKEYLSEVQRLQNMIEHKRDRVKEYRHAIKSAPSARMNPAKVQTSSPVDRIGDMVGKIVDLEAEIQKDMVDIAYKRHEIINMIHGLDSAAHMQVLFGRYIQCKGLDAVAKDIGKSYRYVIEMHGKALEAFGIVHKSFLEKEENYGENGKIQNKGYEGTTEKL